MTPVRIAGVALMSARGANLAEAVTQVRACRSDHGSITVPTADAPCTVPYFAMARPPGLSTGAALVQVCHDALAEAALPAEALMETPLFIGSSSLHIAEAESGESIGKLTGDLNELARRLKTTLGIGGADYTISTACTSSAHAVLAAHALLTAGACRYALVVGVELANLTTVAGFHAMQLLGSGPPRPFDRRRDGLVLGEAVAAVVLSSVPDTVTPWILSGGANRIDTANLAGADPGGAATADLLRRALAHAGLTAQEITLIKAHAAGSPGNDAAEAVALRTVFVAPPSIASLKGYLGHLLGASGCAELALLIGCWRAGFTPVTAGFAMADAALGLAPIERHQSGAPRHALLNFLGFGGGQAALIVSHAAA